jgi:hypothetical protein
VRFFQEQETKSHTKPKSDNKNESKSRGISKEIGEYIDYEEVNK